MPSLFDPIQLGAIKAPNRIFMAPMTRGRATKDHVPTPLIANHYVQRASAGVIISEAIGISRQGMGWPYAPGIWTPEQITGWRQVNDEIHEAGGRIIAQLWHMGRMVHPSYSNGEPPVSASSTTSPGDAHTYAGRTPYTESRPLRLDEMAGIVEDYAQAARNAMEAGFDGVQVHGANGYLIDQFLRDSANFREDAYGGSIENRIRLMREVTQAVVDAVGGDRTGVRLSPNSEVQGVRDSDPLPLFIAAAEALTAIGISHLELKEPPLGSNYGDSYMDPLAPQLRKVFKGPLIVNSDFDALSGNAALDAGICDAVSFGRPFIGNPDLPRRMEEGLPLADNDASKWLVGGTVGYDDYPAYKELSAG